MRAYEREAEFDPELDEYGDTETEHGDGEYDEYEDAEFGDGEYGDGEYGDGELDEFEEEFAEEMEQYLAELEELGGDYPSPLSAEEEMELAEELLELSTEEELDHFLGGLLARAVTSPAARKLVASTGSGIRALLRRAPKVLGRHRAPGRYQQFAARQDQQRVEAARRRLISARQQRRRRELVAHDPAHRERLRRSEHQLRSLPPSEQPAGYRRIRRAETSDWREFRRRGEHPVKRYVRRSAPWIAGGYAANIFTKHVPDIMDVLKGIFEVDPEGMSPEEAEFEAARRYVRLSAAAARNLASARRRARPRRAARAALLAAARRYAPGMYRRFPLYVRPAMGYQDYGPQEPTSFQDTSYQDEPASSPDEPMDFQDEPQPAGSNGRPARRPESGRWMRRGNRIIITGL